MTALRRALAGVTAATVVVAGLLLGGVVGAGSASAHDYLVSTAPAADTTVTEPLTQVVLGFNEPPLTDFASAIAIEVRDAAGANIVTDPVSIVDSTLTVSVAPTAQGEYTVLWQTVSSDGHPVSGEYGFTYAGPVAEPTPTATPGAGEDPTSAPTPPASAEPDETATASPDASGTIAESGDSGALVWVGLGGALIVLAIAGGVVALVTRHRRAA
ncbi:copper resistance protein CopC [Herbiconiux sp. CPCC 203407]|uniref:Copper resistance protein CopC n=1 Tax=Herbiconiux oxytropis TaxID=2970915 RepID=A0AA41XGF7_9MICO|nr:copper resistance protein CopC [Herbiconiux oxytropis]MCS5722980.1 copper resistance protein CopC [Herbiconiux oxytropis]MCS5725208.1 copper resistance protein CopC [Herbiconiux oxytropis]